jgi:hypothetical protein
MRILVFVIISCLLLTLSPSSTVASEVGSRAVWSGVWNGAEMTVVVVTRGHSIREKVSQNEPWWRWGNTSTDAYLFYWSEDDMVDLVVDFTEQNRRPTARIYVPTSVEHRQAIQSFDGGYTLPDELNPSLIIWPVEGDWLIDGLPNFNLDGREADPTTGAMDWEIRVRADAPGIPKWMTRTADLDRDPGAGYPHFGATMRMDPSVPFELADPLIPAFPYLSAVREQGHWEKIQPIFVSHETRTLEQNWTGFHIAGMYQINSISYPSETNFESPFAFYRFDPEAGRYANLVIRSDIWPEGDPHGPPPQHTQRTAVRMTWTGENPRLWRYSLSVTGNHVHEDEVFIGDTKIFAVPYAEYPHWVTSRQWKAATFVEATKGETGSEGIYDFSVEDNYAVTEWINGLRLDAPTELPDLEAEDEPITLESLKHEPIATLQRPYLDFPAIHPLRLKEGFRGEYSLHYDRDPQLYFSPIDNRVHLLYASEGVWNLGNDTVLRTYNLDGGPHIDAWVRERISPTKSEITDEVSIAIPGRFEEALYSLESYMLYSSSNRVELRELEQAPSSEIIPVPEDEATWRQFLDEASPAGLQERDPNDLRKWIRQLPGKSTRISRASASDIRITDEGYRFALKLQDGFRIEGTDHAGIGDLDPGSYLVTYDGEFLIEPLTPPSLSIALSGGPAVELQSERILLDIRNDGMQDVSDATLELLATSDDGQEIVVTSEQIDFMGKSVTSRAIDWAPPGPGTWTLTPTVELANGESFSLEAVSLTVQPASGASPYDFLRVSTDAVARLFAVLGLFSLALMAGIIWRVQSQASAGDEVANER